MHHKKNTLRISLILLIFVFVGFGIFQNCAKINFNDDAAEGLATSSNQDQGDTDSDSDGLPDKVELQLGTDPKNIDSDNDGLTDGEEVSTHSTNPLDKDTDKGGVNDGAEVHRGTDPLDPKDDNPVEPSKPDSDKDGLTDEEENVLGTNPRVADTDRDGLNDGAEVKTYRTDPLNPDTDGGGVWDGYEVREGKNPLDPVDDKEITCELTDKNNRRVQFACPVRTGLCNNGNGNGSEGCSPSDKGNTDEAP